MSECMSRRLLLRGATAGGVIAACGHQTSAGAGEAIVQPATPGAPAFVERAFEMRQLAVDKGDQPYGAIVVRNDIIVGQSWSRVVLDQDPTGHAEVATIRDAARRLGSRSLAGTVMYSSSRPCPMCEAAAYWAGIDSMLYGRNGEDVGVPKLCR